MVSTKAKTLRKSENVLPPGAKLDYREDVDRLHANVMEQVTISVKKTEEILAQNAKLAKQIRDVLDKQQKIFSMLECKPSDGNPVVGRLKDKLSGIDDLAKLSREHEMRICDSLGLTPEGGWERALARLGNSTKGKRTIGELSDILLQKDTSKGPSNEYQGYDSSAEKTSSHGQNVEAVEKAKRAVKRMKI
jgi:hypothetical protein